MSGNTANETTATSNAGRVHFNKCFVASPSVLNHVRIRDCRSRAERGSLVFRLTDFVKAKAVPTAVSNRVEVRNHLLHKEIRRFSYGDMAAAWRIHLETYTLIEHMAPSKLTQLALLPRGGFSAFIWRNREPRRSYVLWPFRQSFRSSLKRPLGRRSKSSENMATTHCKTNRWARSRSSPRSTMALKTWRRCAVDVSSSPAVE